MIINRQLPWKNNKNIFAFREIVLKIVPSKKQTMFFTANDTNIKNFFSAFAVESCVFGISDTTFFSTTITG